MYDGRITNTPPISGCDGEGGEVSGTAIELMVFHGLWKMTSPKGTNQSFKNDPSGWNFRHMETIGILIAAKIISTGSHLSFFSIKTPINPTALSLILKGHGQ